MQLAIAIAPPDPVAALAVGRRAGLPPRLLTLIQGEGLLNDATALTLLSVAVAAATSGSFSPGTTALQFVLASVGGVAVGLLVATAVRGIRRLWQDPLTLNAVSNYIRKPTRPDYIAHRDFTPITTVDDDALLRLARANRQAAE